MHVSKKTISMLTLFLACNIFVVDYVLREDFIYFWDYGYFWGEYRMFSTLLENNPMGAFYDVIHTVYTSDYNHIWALFLGVFKSFFGVSRVGFILAITNIFALPTIYVMMKFFGDFIPKNLREIYVEYPFIPIFCAFLMPLFFIPIVRGYPDIFSVLVINIIFIMYFRVSFENHNYKKLALISVLLAFIVLFRRYYMFWTVSFLATIFLESIFRNRNDFNSIKNDIMKLAFMGFITFSIVILASIPVSMSWMQSDYAKIFSAMKGQDTHYSEFMRITGLIGYAVSVLAFLGFIISALNKSSRRISVFMFIQISIIFFMMFKIQDMDRHHMYMLVTPIIFYISVFCMYVLSKVRENILKVSFLFVFFIFLSLNFSIVFTDSLDSQIGEKYRLLSYARYRPLYRGDIPEIVELLKFLDVNSGENEYVYTISSSYVLSGSIMDRGCETYLPESKLCKKLFYTRDVDLRGSFPMYFFDAEYIVCPTTKQFHLKESGQQVVVLLHKLFLDEKGLGRYYDRMDAEFTLENGVIVHVYKKNVPAIPDEAKMDVLKAFERVYPDEPMFAVSDEMFKS